MYLLSNISGTYNIGTMLQFRNFPCDVILGGNAYISGVASNLGDRTIQASAVGMYLRPNYTGAIAPGVISFMLIGIDY